MRSLIFFVLRALCALLVGFLLVSNPNEMSSLLVQVIGGLFVLSAVLVILGYYVSRYRVRRTRRQLAALVATPDTATESVTDSVTDSDSETETDTASADSAAPTEPTAARVPAPLPLPRVPARNRPTARVPARMPSLQVPARKLPPPRVPLPLPLLSIFPDPRPPISTSASARQRWAPSCCSVRSRSPIS